MDRPARLPSARAASRLLGSLAALAAVAAAAALLSPAPLADAFFAAWVLAAVGLALVGAAAAWTNRTALVWLAALLLAALSVAGMWSVGPYVAPAAVLLLGAAVVSWRAGPRSGSRAAAVADPPTVLEAVLKTLVGAGAVVAGAGLVYAGAVRRELFGACASETLACALGVARWDAVGTTALGLVAVGAGGWLVWRQVSVGRALAAESGAS